ncbi:hypothetical protein [Thalassovita aquimarina]|uniref:Uncharacterized protein n=1 Tax=Thalassovita aquimarina TaxID=2785917 RepID=A0ABS5HX25_9RHOB|nr:hypothetical protein [Thalassovita aquimarina]MBR9653502.1 hypothetical protein [Thalassovita aquimarina]
MESRVLSGLKPRLLSPDLLGHFVEEYCKAFNEAAAGFSHERRKAETSLKKIESKIDGIMKAIEDGMYHASMKAKMSELETEKAHLLAIVEESPEAPCPAAASEPVRTLPGADRRSGQRPERTEREGRSNGGPARVDSRSSDDPGRRRAWRPSH